MASLTFQISAVNLWPTNSLCSPRATPFHRLTPLLSTLLVFEYTLLPCGIHGMKRERIRCTSDWRCRGRREDCVIVDVDPAEAPGGLQAARVKLLFTLKYGQEKPYECALVHWYADHASAPDEDTGMRILSPSVREDGHADLDVVHLDSIVHAAHLTPVYGPEFVPDHLSFSDTLDIFRAFYLNCWIDHHMYHLIRASSR
jgi:hypothetical protein